MISDEFDVEESEIPGDVSNGRIADHKAVVASVFPEEMQKKFEIFSYRNAAVILKNSFPNEFRDIFNALEQFNISEEMIRFPGGSKGPVAKYVDTLLPEKSGWLEARISADLKVKILHAKKKDMILSEYTLDGFPDGHRIDFLNGRVAFDLEWNSKDQTYDRDLYAFSAFYEAGDNRCRGDSYQRFFVEQCFFPFSWQGVEERRDRRR